MFTPETWQDEKWGNLRKPRKKAVEKFVWVVAVSNMFGIFTPKLGEDESNLMHIVQRGLVKNHQLVSGWKMKVPFEMVQFLGGTC